MDEVLRHLAQAAFLLLFVEFLVLLLIAVALCGGMAFGLRWGRGKLGGVFGRLNGLLPTAKSYVRKGTDLLAKPFITAEGGVALVRGTAESIRRTVQSAHRSGDPPPPREVETPADLADTLV